MSAVEEMLGLFQRYECFEQAPAVVRGHFWEGQNFGGEQSLEGFYFSSFLEGDLKSWNGDQRNRKCGGSFWGISRKCSVCTKNPRRPVTPPRKILGPPKSGKRPIFRGELFFCFALGCVGNPNISSWVDLEHPYLPSHDFPSRRFDTFLSTFLCVPVEKGGGWVWKDVYLQTTQRLETLGKMNPIWLVHRF